MCSGEIALKNNHYNSVVVFYGCRWRSIEEGKVSICVRAFPI